MLEQPLDRLDGGFVLVASIAREIEGAKQNRPLAGCASAGRRRSCARKALFYKQFAQGTRAAGMLASTVCQSVK